MIALHLLTGLCVLAGLVFFAAGTVGLLRLPDPLTRLHALAKADNIGLGLIALGVLPQLVASGAVLAAAKVVAIWLLLQLSSGAVAQLLAEVAFRDSETGADDPDGAAAEAGEP
ncbi:cation:proton antiporter [Xanthobacter sp. ZOL 2024]